MNTFEFFNRLLRPLTANSLESLGANEGLELVDALNAGLQKFYAHAPTHYRRSDAESFTVRAPQAMIGDFTKGSATIENVDYVSVPTAFIINGAGSSEVDDVYFSVGLDGSKERFDGQATEVYTIWEASEWRVRDASTIYYSSAEDVALPTDVVTWTAEPGASAPLPTLTILSEVLSLDLRGSSVLIDSDWNRIKEANTLQHTYQGETGRKQFTLYGDSISLSGANVDRLLSDPVLDGDTQLDPLPERQLLSTTGTPSYFKLQHVGDSRADTLEPTGLLYLYPVPVVAGRVSIDILHRPQRFKLDSLLRTPATLPLPDDLIERILLPIAIAELVDSEQWRNEKTIRRADARAFDAIEAAKQLESYIEVPTHTVGTPIGY